MRISTGGVLLEWIFYIQREWRDLLSEKSIKLCLLTRLIGCGSAHDEATRPSTAAYFAKDMLAICLFDLRRL